MPRDLVAEATALPDLSVPTLAGMAFILRNPVLWPHGHTWDFSVGLDMNSRCSLGHTPPLPICKSIGCAKGMAWRLWGSEAGDLAMREQAHGDAHDQIFTAGMNGHAHRITPEVVASRIDDFLAGRPIRFIREGDRDSLVVAWYAD